MQYGCLKGKGKLFSTPPPGQKYTEICRPGAVYFIYPLPAGQKYAKICGPGPANSMCAPRDGQTDMQAHCPGPGQLLLKLPPDLPLGHRLLAPLEDVEVPAEDVQEVDEQHQD